MMSQEEWIACTDLDRLLWSAAIQHRLSARKLVLLACASARRVWHLLPDERGRRLVEGLEELADGQPFLPGTAVVQEVSALASAILFSPAGARRQATHSSPQAPILPHAVQNVLVEARVVKAFASRQPPSKPNKAVRIKERREQRLLLRDLCGNPYDRARDVPPVWLAWSDRIIPNLARVIYEERDFRRLRILGDALEEAGCDDVAILEHCRGPGPHARGCWVLDQLLDDCRALSRPTREVGSGVALPGKVATEAARPAR